MTEDAFYNYESRTGVRMSDWNEEIVENGAFVIHPEYAHGLREQGLTPGPAHLLGVGDWGLGR